MKRYEIELGRALFLVVAAALLGAWGCGAPPAGRSYSVRGKVAQIAVPGNPATEFMIQHQAIDDFVDAEGRQVGMDSMTMSFPLAPGVSTAGLAVGDPVEFTLHVDWRATPPVHITRLAKLPPGTLIVFGEAKPPGKKT